MIYFVRDPAADLVKIGYSAAPWVRFSKIQSDCPAALTLEAVMEGAPEDEAALHRRFAEARVRGEWFRWRGPVAAFVSVAECVPNPCPGKKSTPKREITAALEALGFHKSYASRLHRGNRPWSLPLAVGVWRLSGHKRGPVADAPDDHLAILAQYVGEPS